MKLTGERNAIASAVFGFFGLVYTLFAIMEAQPAFTKAYWALAAIYGTAFFAIVARYFWARWYAVGVGISGTISGAVGIWQLGPEPIVLFLGGAHLLAVIMLSGETMTSPFEGQTAWRQRFHLDDNAVTRLGKSVTRAAISLPFILVYAFAPKPDALDVTAIPALLAAGLVGLGIHGLVRMRTWSLFSLAAATAAMGTAAAAAPTLALGLGATAVAGLLIAALAPVLVPAVKTVIDRG